MVIDKDLRVWWNKSFLIICHCRVNAIFTINTHTHTHSKPLMLLFVILSARQRNNTVTIWSCENGSSRLVTSVASRSGWSIIAWWIFKASLLGFVRWTQVSFIPLCPPAAAVWLCSLLVVRRLMAFYSFSSSASVKSPVERPRFRRQSQRLNQSIGPLIVMPCVCSVLFNISFIHSI